MKTNRWIYRLINECFDNILIFPSCVNAQIGEKSKLLKSDYFGNFNQATKIKQHGSAGARERNDP
jgi:hypothetical protein